MSDRPSLVTSKTTQGTAIWLPPLHDRLGRDSIDITVDGDQRLVARVMPNADDLPIFPLYDVDREAATMEMVRTSTDVPVPAGLFTEPTGKIIGQPFMIIEAATPLTAAPIPR